MDHCKCCKKVHTNIPLISPWTEDDSDDEQCLKAVMDLSGAEDLSLDWFDTLTESRLSSHNTSLALNRSDLVDADTSSNLQAWSPCPRGGLFSTTETRHRARHTGASILTSPLSDSSLEQQRSKFNGFGSSPGTVSSPSMELLAVNQSDIRWTSAMNTPPCAPHTSVNGNESCTPGVASQEMAHLKRLKAKVTHRKLFSPGIQSPSKDDSLLHLSDLDCTTEMENTIVQEGEEETSVICAEDVDKTVLSVTLEERDSLCHSGSNRLLEEGSDKNVQTRESVIENSRNMENNPNLPILLDGAGSIEMRESGGRGGKNNEMSLSCGLPNSEDLDIGEGCKVVRERESHAVCDQLEVKDQTNCGDEGLSECKREVYSNVDDACSEMRVSEPILDKKHVESVLNLLFSSPNGSQDSGNSEKCSETINSKLSAESSLDNNCGRNALLSRDSCVSSVLLSGQSIINNGGSEGEEKPELFGESMLNCCIPESEQLSDSLCLSAVLDGENSLQREASQLNVRIEDACQQVTGLESGASGGCVNVFSNLEEESGNSVQGISGETRPVENSHQNSQSQPDLKSKSERDSLMEDVKECIDKQREYDDRLSTSPIVHGKGSQKPMFPLTLSAQRPNTLLMESFKSCKPTSILKSPNTPRSKHARKVRFSLFNPHRAHCSLSSHADNDNNDAELEANTDQRGSCLSASPNTPMMSGGEELNCCGDGDRIGDSVSNQEQDVSEVTCQKSSVSDGSERFTEKTFDSDGMSSNKNSSMKLDNTNFANFPQDCREGQSGNCINNGNQFTVSETENFTDEDILGNESFENNDFIDSPTEIFEDSFISSPTFVKEVLVLSEMRKEEDNGQKNICHSSLQSAGNGEGTIVHNVGRKYDNDEDRIDTAMEKVRLNLCAPVDVEPPNRFEDNTRSFSVYRNTATSSKKSKLSGSKTELSKCDMKNVETSANSIDMLQCMNNVSRSHLEVEESTGVIQEGSRTNSSDSTPHLGLGSEQGSPKEGNEFVDPSDSLLMAAYDDSSFSNCLTPDTSDNATDTLLKSLETYNDDSLSNVNIKSATTEFNVDSSKLSETVPFHPQSLSLLKSSSMYTTQSESSLPVMAESVASSFAPASSVSPVPCSTSSNVKETVPYKSSPSAAQIVSSSFVRLPSSESKISGIKTETLTNSSPSNDSTPTTSTHALVAFDPSNVVCCAANLSFGRPRKFVYSVKANTPKTEDKTEGSSNKETLRSHHALSSVSNSILVATNDNVNKDSKKSEEFGKVKDSNENVVLDNSHEVVERVTVWDSAPSHPYGSNSVSVPTTQHQLSTRASGKYSKPFPKLLGFARFTDVFGESQDMQDQIKSTCTTTGTKDEAERRCTSGRRVITTKEEEQCVVSEVFHCVGGAEQQDVSTEKSTAKKDRGLVLDESKNTEKEKKDKFDGTRQTLQLQCKTTDDFCDWEFFDSCTDEMCTDLMDDGGSFPGEPEGNRSCSHNRDYVRKEELLKMDTFSHEKNEEEIKENNVKEEDRGILKKEERRIGKEEERATENRECLEGDDNDKNDEIENDLDGISSQFWELTEFSQTVNPDLSIDNGIRTKSSLMNSEDSSRVEDASSKNDLMKVDDSNDKTKCSEDGNINMLWSSSNGENLDSKEDEKLLDVSVFTAKDEVCTPVDAYCRPTVSFRHKGNPVAGSTGLWSGISNPDSTLDGAVHSDNNTGVHSKTIYSQAIHTAGTKKVGNLSREMQKQREAADFQSGSKSKLQKFDDLFFSMELSATTGGLHGKDSADRAKGFYGNEDSVDVELEDQFENILSSFKRKSTLGDSSKSKLNLKRKAPADKFRDSNGNKPALKTRVFDATANSTATKNEFSEMDKVRRNMVDRKKSTTSNKNKIPGKENNDTNDRGEVVEDSSSLNKIRLNHVSNNSSEFDSFNTATKATSLSVLGTDQENSTNGPGGKLSLRRDVVEVEETSCLLEPHSASNERFNSWNGEARDTPMPGFDFSNFVGGFQTAGGKTICLSEAAKAKAGVLWKSTDSDTNTAGKEDINHNLGAAHSNKQVHSDSLNKRILNGEEKDNEIFRGGFGDESSAASSKTERRECLLATGGGFTTAGGKDIALTEAARKKAQSLWESVEWEGKSALHEGKSALPEGKSALHEGKSALHEGKSALHEGKSALHEGKSALLEGKSALPEGKSALHEGKSALHEGKSALHEGKSALHEGKSALLEEKSALLEGKSALHEGNSVINILAEGKSVPPKTKEATSALSSEKEELSLVHRSVFSRKEKNEPQRTLRSGKDIGRVDDAYSSENRIKVSSCKKDKFDRSYKGFKPFVRPKMVKKVGKNVKVEKEGGELLKAINVSDTIFSGPMSDKSLEMEAETIIMSRGNAELREGNVAGAKVGACGDSYKYDSDFKCHDGKAMIVEEGDGKLVKGHFSFEVSTSEVNDCPLDLQYPESEHQGPFEENFNTQILAHVDREMSAFEFDAGSGKDVCFEESKKKISIDCQESRKLREYENVDGSVNTEPSVKLVSEKPLMREDGRIFESANISLHSDGVNSAVCRTKTDKCVNYKGEREEKRQEVQSNTDGSETEIRIKLPMLSERKECDGDSFLGGKKNYHQFCKEQQNLNIGNTGRRESDFDLRDRMLDDNNTSATIPSTSTVKEQSRSKATFAGFSTASGSNVPVSLTALRKARALLEDGGDCLRAGNAPRTQSSNKDSKFNEAEGSSLSAFSIASGVGDYVYNKNDIDDNHSSHDYNDNENDDSGLQVEKCLDEEEVTSERERIEWPDQRQESKRSGDAMTMIPRKSFGIGFSTASGLAVKVSKKALDHARAFLKEDDNDDGGHDDLREEKIQSEKCLNVKDENLKHPRKTTKSVSTDACADRLYSSSSISRPNVEFLSKDCKQAKPRNIKNFCISSNDCEDSLSQSGKGLDIINKEGDNTTAVSVTEKSKSSLSHFGGFSTASGLEVGVSMKALEKAKNLWNCEADNFTNVGDGHPELVETTNCRSRTENMNYPVGFSTASGLDVSVSAESLGKAKVFLNRDDVKEVVEMKCLKVKENGDEINVGRGKFPGFSTAFGSSVSVSEKALQQAKALFDNEDGAAIPVKIGVGQNMGKSSLTRNDGRMQRKDNKKRRTSVGDMASNTYKPESPEEKLKYRRESGSRKRPLVSRCEELLNDRQPGTAKRSKFQAVYSTQLAGEPGGTSSIDRERVDTTVPVSHTFITEDTTPEPCVTRKANNKPTSFVPPTRNLSHHNQPGSNSSGGGGENGIKTAINYTKRPVFFPKSGSGVIGFIRRMSKELNSGETTGLTEPEENRDSSASYTEKKNCSETPFQNRIKDESKRKITRLDTKGDAEAVHIKATEQKACVKGGCGISKTVVVDDRSNSEDKNSAVGWKSSLNTVISSAMSLDDEEENKFLCENVSSQIGMAMVETNASCVKNKEIGTSGSIDNSSSSKDFSIVKHAIIENDIETAPIKQSKIGRQTKRELIYIENAKNAESRLIDGNENGAWLSALEEARLKQEKVVGDKKRLGKVVPRRGRWMEQRERTVQGRNVWVDLKSLNVSSRDQLSRNQLLQCGVSNATLSVCSENAADFQFDLRRFYPSNPCRVLIGDGAVLVPNDRGLAGYHEFYKAFLTLESVDPKLVDKAWVKNHYRWIVWKLASYEVASPHVFAGRCLTPHNVMLQLKYRCDRDVDRAERSAIRKVVEKDDAAAKRMVLCVAAVRTTQGSAGTQQTTLELTDGWYSIWSRLDPPLSALVSRSRLSVGVKVVTSGAELEGAGQGCSPLEMGEEVRLVLRANTTRPAPWHSKLGFQSHPTALCVPLSSLHPEGGMVGCVDVVVTRIYPLMYMERQSEGGCVFRTQDEEDEERKRKEAWREAEVEGIYLSVQAQMEREDSDKNAKTRKRRVWRKKEIEALGSGDELLRAWDSAWNQEDLQALLTEDQVEKLMRQQQVRMEERRDRLNKRVKEAMGEHATHPQQRGTSTVPLQKVAVVGCSSRDIDAKCETTVTIWRPTSPWSELQEGRRYRMYHLTASASRWNRGRCKVALATTRPSRIQELPIRDNLLDVVFQPRETLSVQDIVRLAWCDQEFDFVGVALQVEPAVKPGQPILITAADGHGDLLLLKVWKGLQNGSVSVKEKECFVALNLVKNQSGRSRSLDHSVNLSVAVIVVARQEFSTLSTCSHSSKHGQRLATLQKQVAQDAGYLERLSQKLRGQGDGQLHAGKSENTIAQSAATSSWFWDQPSGKQNYQEDFPPEIVEKIFNNFSSPEVETPTHPPRHAVQFQVTVKAKSDTLQSVASTEQPDLETHTHPILGGKTDKETSSINLCVNPDQICDSDSTGKSCRGGSVSTKDTCRVKRKTKCEEEEKKEEDKEDNEEARLEEGDDLMLKKRKKNFRSKLSKLMTYGRPSALSPLPGKVISPACGKQFKSPHLSK